MTETPEIIPLLPEEYKVTLISFSDLSLILSFIVAIVLAACIFELIIIQVIEVIHKFNRKHSSINNTDDNSLLKSLDFTQFGTKYLRGRNK
jgi:hypothetical protein